MAQKNASHFSCEFTDDEFGPAVHNFNQFLNKQLLLSHYRTGKGELIQLDAKDVYEKNFGLNPKGGFSGVRWHIGNSIL